MLVCCQQRKWTWLLVFCLYSSFLVLAQNAILLSKDITPDHDIIFTPSYIKQFNLKSVVLDLLDKRDNEMLKDYQKKKRMAYDSLGNCKSVLYTFPSIYGNIFTTAKVKDGKVLKREQALAFDSIMQYYYYNPQRQFIKTVQGNGLQFYNYFYSYDNEGHLTAAKKIYEVCKVFYEGACEPEHQKLLFEESYTTVKFGLTQSKTTVYNDEKRPFKEIIRNYNESGLIISEEERFLLSPFYTKYVWQYNSKGELLTKSYFKEEKEQWKMLFSYEENGRLYTEKIYKAGMYTNELMYVYESATGVLGSYINRDVVNKSMQIVKCSYVLN